MVTVPGLPVKTAVSKLALFQNSLVLPLSQPRPPSIQVPLPPCAPAWLMLVSHVSVAAARAGSAGRQAAARAAEAARERLRRRAERCIRTPSFVDVLRAAYPMRVRDGNGRRSGATGAPAAL